MDSLIAWATKYAILLIVCAVAAFGLGIWAWRAHEQSLVNAAAPAEAAAKVNAADAQSGKDAVNAVNDNDKKSTAIDDTTRKNNVIIIHEPGASVNLDPALDAAGRAAICMHDSAAGLPECQRLRQSSPQ